MSIEKLLNISANMRKVALIIENKL